MVSGCSYFLSQFLRNLGPLNVLAHLVMKDVGNLVNEVDDAGEIRLGPNRKLNRSRQSFQSIDDHVHGAVERRTDAIHLINEADSRYRILVGLTPYGF